MEIIGYIASVFIGISLGLIGGGGSILTMPVLVYLFGQGEDISTSYSLFIVGVTALIGGIKSTRAGNVNYKALLVFGIPAIIATKATRKYLFPQIPEVIFTTDSFVLSKGVAIMIFFALIMVVAAISMIRDKRTDNDETESKQSPKFNVTIILFEGAITGLISGILGAGGGFLIIPALVFYAKLPMKNAVGTSLLIIAAKSLLTFFWEDVAQFGSEINWNLLLTITVIAVGGIFIGTYLSKFIDGKKLKKGFGWFVLVMAVYIILKQIV